MSLSIPLHIVCSRGRFDCTFFPSFPCFYRRAAGRAASRRKNYPKPIMPYNGSQNPAFKKGCLRKQTTTGVVMEKTEEGVTSTPSPARGRLPSSPGHLPPQLSIQYDVENTSSERGIVPIKSPPSLVPEFSRRVATLVKRQQNRTAYQNLINHGTRTVT